MRALQDRVVPAPKAHIRAPQLERLALPPLDHPLIPRLLLRTLRLNCLTDAYAPLWEEVWEASFAEDEWLLGKGYEGAPSLGDVGARWTPSTSLRCDVDRRNALVDSDALMAVMLGIAADELSTIYRTQFAVLHGYDQTDYLYDANGRLVPTAIRQAWRKQGDKLPVEDRTEARPDGSTITYALPLRALDREHDFHRAMSRLSGSA